MRHKTFSSYTDDMKTQLALVLYEISLEQVLWTNQRVKKS